MKDTFRKKLYGYRKNLELDNKWWHRLGVVVFYIFIIFCLPFFISMFYFGLPDQMWNTKILYNIKEHAAQSTADNTVEGFIESRGNLACLQESNYQYVSAYHLKNLSVCNADLERNVDVVTKEIVGLDEYSNLSIDELKPKLLEKLQESEIKYCLIPMSIGCSSGDIVKYRHNYLHLIVSGIAGVILTVFTSLIILNLYYRGLLYIIFGDQDKK